MLLQSPLGVPRTQRAGAQRVQAPNAAALACRSQPSAAPRRAQLASRAAPALRLRPRQRPRGARGLPVASAAEGSSTNGAVVPAGGSASAVAITGVAVFSAAPYVHDFLKAPLQAAFGEQKVKFIDARLNAQTALLAQGASVVCAFVNDSCDAEVCAALAQQGVKLIAMRCAGFDRVDVAAAAQHGITVVRVPSYSPHAIAEHAVAMLLCLNRGLHKAYNRVREGNFTLNGLTGFEIRGKVVGIIGTGKIGTVTAQIFCRGFGARLLAYDAYPNADITAMGGEYVSLETLLEQSDIISLHCPLSKSTFHLIASEQIARMKRGVMLINTSRGGLLDTRAVIAGLENGAIGGLCIDVYENEGPLFFRDFSALNRGKRMKNWDEQMGRLLSLPNVLVTPHSAFLTNEALGNIATTTIDNINAFARGDALVNAVQPPPQ